MYLQHFEKYVRAERGCFVLPAFLHIRVRSVILNDGRVIFVGPQYGLLVTLLGSRILRRLVDFWKVCGPLSFFIFVAQQPLVGHGLFFSEASRSHSDTPQSVGLLWTSDQPGAETYT